MAEVVGLMAAAVGLMAEAVGKESITAAILLSDRINRILKALEEQPDTPRDLHGTISLEVSTLKAVFEDLKLLQNSNTASSILQRLSEKDGVIERCINTLSQLGNLLDSQLKKALDDTLAGGLRRRTVRAIAWPSKERKARQLLEEITGYKSMIMMSLLAESANVGSKSKENTPSEKSQPDSKRELSLVSKLLGYAFDPSTLVALLFFFVFLSGIAVAFALQQAREPVCEPHFDKLKEDDGFWALLSQLFLQILSVYCTIYPVVRARLERSLAEGNHREEINVSKLWFFSLATVNLFASILAISIYASSWKVATVVSFISGFAATLSTAQLAAALEARKRVPVVRPRDSC